MMNSFKSNITHFNIYIHLILYRNKIQLNKTIHEKMTNISFFDSFTQSPEITNIPGGCQFNAMRVFNVCIRYIYI
jgi:hypothetical protein